jgi:hypothetical protein
MNQCKLYKYKKFNGDLLEMLAEKIVYYANPKDFNDPLDCKPEFYNDIDSGTLERLCLKIGLSRDDISRADYMSREPVDECLDRCSRQDQYRFLLSKEVQRVIYEEMECYGVLSLSETPLSVLMWSHYGDQHNGLCIEYDYEIDTKMPPKVNYDRPRIINVSDIVHWKLDGCQESWERVFETFFFVKALGWEYESERRHVIKGLQGQCVSQHPRISSVYFGLRCSQAVVASVATLLACNNYDIEFRRICTKDSGFDIDSYSLDLDDIKAWVGRPSVYEMFKGIPSTMEIRDVPR